VFGDVRCSGLGDSLSCVPALKAVLWTALYFTFHGGAKFQQAIVTLVHQLLQQRPEDEVLHEVAMKFYPNSLTPDVAMSLLLSLLRQLSKTL
jgi:hypothetical protein